VKGELVAPFFAAAGHLRPQRGRQEQMPAIPLAGRKQA
jgi:hypothetical protein